MIDVYELISKVMSIPTEYEKENDIKITNSKIIINTETIKIINRYTDDGEVGVYIFYRVKETNWFWWLPTEQQIKVIKMFINIYEEVN